MALRCQRGLDQQNQIPNKPRRHGIMIFCKERLRQCIKGVSGTSVTLDSSSVISQLANWIQPSTNTFESSELYNYKKQPHQSAQPPCTRTRAQGNCSSPCCTPFLEHTFTGTSVRCNTTSAHTGLCGSSNETTMVSMWDSMPHMPHHTFGK